MMNLSRWFLLLMFLSGLSVSADGLFQKIQTRDGVLYFEDGSEVNLWGVNFQPSLSFEHASRMHNQGVLMPLNSRDLKKVTDESFDQIQTLGSELIRIHLAPADFTDAAGNLQETFWLDMLDYVLAKAQCRGIYVYLTFLNHLDHDGTQFPPNPESFAMAFEREEWMTEAAAVDATENCIRQLLNRRNPYNGLFYKNNPALALLEPINEPAYLWFEEWQKENDGGTREEFKTWRYQNTLTYLNRMVRVLREEGMEQPIVWNCGWSRLIQGREDVYQAIADSAVDVVSFCCYPGQDDLKNPFWKYPENLSTNNYLPYLKQCEQDDWLGWLRRDAFADKAKVVYEYETMCNQSAYMYPAMAKLFRDLGAQVAAQWTYGLSGYAEYLGGTHVFNLKTTPRKAAAFMVAKQQFKDEQTTWSYESRSCSVFHSGTLIYSGKVGASAPGGPQTIIGIGGSEFVSYDGTGLYFVEPCENDALLITIMPDSEFIRPHWFECHTGDRVVKLDSETAHVFELNLPDFGKTGWLYRKNGTRWELQQKLDGAVRFDAFPGEYLLEKEKLIIDRKILEEED